MSEPVGSGGRRRVAILVGDGMGDFPLPAHGGLTPLQVAQMPNCRRIAGAGRSARIRTVPEGMEPGSDVANLSLFGYNPAACYTGRAPIEAAGRGIELHPDDVAFRCNLVTVRDGRMLDYSAGHISTAEAATLIASLQAVLGRDGLRFVAGVSYRHLLIWRSGPSRARLRPPHDIAGEPVADHAPTGERAEEIQALMERSRTILADHPINEARRAAGQPEATQIWLWGQGKRMTLPAYPDLFGRHGGVVSAVDLVKGIGRLAGLEAPDIPGATGFLDTNYEGKVATALSFLRASGFAFVHYEAPDECGHLGDTDLKIQACAWFDARIVGPIWRALEEDGVPYRLVVTTDHLTPCSVRGHVGGAVPIAWVDGPCGRTEREGRFDESIGGDPIAACDLIRTLL